MMRRFFQNGFVVLAIWIITLSIVACDRGAFKKENPVTVKVIEKTVYVIQELAEDKVEEKLNLPHDSLDFNYKVFADDARAVD